MQKFEYRTPRISTNFPIRLTVDGKEICGRCTDISEGGLGAALPQALPVGAVGAVALVSPTQEIEVRAKIVAYLDLDRSGQISGINALTVVSPPRVPPTPEIGLQAKIAHSGLHRTGIAFLFAGEEDRDLVRKFIETVPRQR